MEYIDDILDAFRRFGWHSQPYVESVDGLITNTFSRQRSKISVGLENNLRKISFKSIRLEVTRLTLSSRSGKSQLSARETTSSMIRESVLLLLLERELKAGFFLLTVSSAISAFLLRPFDGSLPRGLENGCPLLRN